MYINDSRLFIKHFGDYQAVEQQLQKLPTEKTTGNT